MKFITVDCKNKKYGKGCQESKRFCFVLKERMLACFSFCMNYECTSPDFGKLYVVIQFKRLPVYFLHVPNRSSQVGKKGGNRNLTTVGPYTRLKSFILN